MCLDVNRSARKEKKKSNETHTDRQGRRQDPEFNLVMNKLNLTASGKIRIRCEKNRRIMANSWQSSRVVTKVKKNIYLALQPMLQCNKEQKRKLIKSRYYSKVCVFWFSMIAFQGNPQHLCFFIFTNVHFLYKHF